MMTTIKVIKYNVFSTIPFGKPHSKEFIYAAKNGHLDVVEHMLQECRYLVYDYDHVS